MWACPTLSVYLPFTHSYEELEKEFVLTAVSPVVREDWSQYISNQSALQQHYKQLLFEMLPRVDEMNTVGVGQLTGTDLGYWGVMPRP